MNRKLAIYKIVLLGDSGVGKTCIFQRYCNDIFQEIHMATIGLDCMFKKLQLDGGKIIKFQIWDIADQERFRSNEKGFRKGAHGFILIYDITNKKAIDTVRYWYNYLRQEFSDEVEVILAGNKCDLVDKRKLKYFKK